MASPGNQHCANCIGTFSLIVPYKLTVDLTTHRGIVWNCGLAGGVNFVRSHTRARPVVVPWSPRGLTKCRNCFIRNSRPSSSCRVLFGPAAAPAVTCREYLYAANIYLSPSADEEVKSAQRHRATSEAQYRLSKNTAIF